MDNVRGPRIVGAWIVGLASLVVYTLTVAPTVAFWDVGEFIATAVTMGVPHPPGAPTFVLLGRLFTLAPTPFGVAAEVNYISVLSSALTALLLYGIILEVLHLWQEGHEDRKRIPYAIQAMAAATGAFAYAFSNSAWFNAVEAEVYGLSMMVTALCLWLAFRHVRGGGDPKRASLLLLVGYIMGVGAGNHLLALLTIPSILILLWYLDRPVLTRMDFWIGAVVLFIVGYSVYVLLYIRSGLNPPIDMNNPETIQNFTQFIQRKQYGQQDMLFLMFPRNAGWSYQLEYHFLRYFRSQFLLPFYALALIGAMMNLYRDKRTFFAVAALWVIMGFGLVIYLNMPDPQPRDRDYIFVGCFFATAIWIGTSIAGITGYLREVVRTSFVRTGNAADGEASPAAEPGGGLDRKVGRWVTATIGVLAAALVIVQLSQNYHSHDRTDDYLAWDYGYNILASCPPNTILFTNGDNDTYPLWYLQVVEGIRRDVRVVNLSLLNTGWYIKELRDRLPQVPINLSDQQIERSLGGTWVYADTTVQVAGASMRLRGDTVFRTQDRFVAQIIANNQWQRPAYFAITVPLENQAGFTMNCQLEGFAFRLLTDEQIAAHPIAPTPGMGTVDPDVTMATIRDRFQYRGILDPLVYKDENSSNLLINYGVVVATTVRGLMELDRREEADELLDWASEHISLNSAQRLLSAEFARMSGDTTRALQIWNEIADDPEAPANFLMSAYANLIYTYGVMGDIDGAASVLERWLELSPTDATARSWLDSLKAGVVPEGLRRMGAEGNS
jgi:tetratricopeptide (TPR) repeat protein